MTQLPSLECAEKDVAEIFGITHLDDRALISSENGYTFILLKAAERYIRNPKESCRKFSAKAFDAAAAKNLRAFHVVYLFLTQSQGIST